MPTLVVFFCPVVGFDSAHDFALHHAEEGRQDPSLLAAGTQLARRSARHLIGTPDSDAHARYIRWPRARGVGPGRRGDTVGAAAVLQ